MSQVPAVQKAVAILRLIAEGRASTSSTALARRLNASQSTCYRILKTLEAEGLIQPHEGGYKLATGLLPLVRPLTDLRQIVEQAQPILDALADRTDMTAKLCVRQNSDQVAIAVAQPLVPLGILAPVGVSYSVVRAAAGAVLLAGEKDEEIEQIIRQMPENAWQFETPDDLWARIRQCRETGIIENIGTHPRGIDAIACPVETRLGRVALTLICPRGELTEKVLPRRHQELRKAKVHLESRLRDQSGEVD
jgi:DNA-binding IclR family transcriptional regulator